MERTDTHSVTADDGTRIAYVDEGAGEPILLLPGLGYASWSWTRQVGSLSRHGRVLAVDNRGTGRSETPEGPYTIDQMALDALAVASVASGPVHVVGASMGGYIALTLALRNPAAVKSLTLIASTSGGPGSTPVPESTLRAWAAAGVMAPEDYARATMPLSFAPGWTAEHPAEFEELLQLRLRHPTSSRAWTAQFAACADYLENGAPPGDIDDIPTLVIHGTADRVVPYDNMSHVASRLPRAKQITLRGAGHLCWIERDASVNQALVDQIALAV